MIVPSHKEISLSRQSALLGVSRESFYYKPIISPEDIRAMNAIDEVYTAYPFYGSRRMKPELESRGISIGRHHIRRLMRKMGLEAVYPKPRLSIPNAPHEKYPYLLSEIKATYSNQDKWGDKWGQPPLFNKKYDIIFSPCLVTQELILEIRSITSLMVDKWGQPPLFNKKYDIIF